MGVLTRHVMNLTSTLVERSFSGHGLLVLNLSRRCHVIGFQFVVALTGFVSAAN